MSVVGNAAPEYRLGLRVGKTLPNHDCRHLLHCSRVEQGHHKRDSLWERTYHYYNFNRTEFLAHYHKRSNVETTFSMIKAKFGGSVRSKTPVAQVNEVLVKILCHNICVLIQSVYELGVEPIFSTETFGTKEAVVPKVAWE